MKTVLLVVMLAALATAAVVEVPGVGGGDEVDAVDVNEMPEVIVFDVDELTDEAEEPQTAIATRRNLSVGAIGSGDTLRFNNVVSVNAIANRVQVRDYRFNPNRRITAIRVTRVGASQNATPSIIGGGLGNSFVTIRIRTAAGRGFNYRIQVYVR